MLKHIVFDCDGTLIRPIKGGGHSLFPGVKELILELSSDCLLYLWTGRDLISARRILTELGILSYFDSLSTADAEYPKPHPRSLKSLLGDIHQKNVCVIGDSPIDVMGAKQFGALCIAVNWSGDGNERALKQAGADFLVKDPAECSRLIRLNLKGDTHV